MPTGYDFPDFSPVRPNRFWAMSKLGYPRSIVSLTSIALLRRSADHFHAETHCEAYDRHQEVDGPAS